MCQVGGFTLGCGPWVPSVCAVDLLHRWSDSLASAPVMTELFPEWLNSLKTLISTLTFQWSRGFLYFLLHWIFNNVFHQIAVQFVWWLVSSQCATRFGHLRTLGLNFLWCKSITSIIWKTLNGKLVQPCWWVWCSTVSIHFGLGMFACELWQRTLAALLADGARNKQGCSVGALNRTV